jgi:hypothetical protein
VGPFLRDPVAFTGHLFTPSGSRHCDDNSFILNFDEPPSGIVDKVSGYIDGLALEVTIRDDCSEVSSGFVLRSLDDNPNACAHLVNHSIYQANSRIVAFAWYDVLPPNFECGNEMMFDLPNIARKDGAPRYIYTHGSEMTFYEEGEQQFSTADVCGAMLCAESDLDADVELLRDYRLEEPLPDWAADWYTLPDREDERDDDSEEDHADEDRWKLSP